MRHLTVLSITLGLIVALPSVLFGQQTGTDKPSETSKKSYVEQISREFSITNVSQTSGGG